MASTSTSTYYLRRTRKWVRTGTYTGYWVDTVLAVLHYYWVLSTEYVSACNVRFNECVWLLKVYYLYCNRTVKQVLQVWQVWPYLYSYYTVLVPYSMYLTGGSTCSRLPVFETSTIFVLLQVVRVLYWVYCTSTSPSTRTPYVRVPPV